MKGITLNKLHRYAGIVIAPFLIIQMLSGLLLSFGLFRRTGLQLPDNGLPLSREGWDALLVRTHFGPGAINDAYHLLLGIGILWMSVSGWLLFLRIRRSRKRGGAAASHGAAS